jgi:bla regulator protein BlaR1
MESFPVLHDVLAVAGDHVWQSTLFASAAALAALAFRRHHAGVRYWLWLAASAKFLIPFAALAALGGLISWRTVDVIPYEDPAVLVGVVSEPFSQSVLTIRPSERERATGSVLQAAPAALASIWGVGCAAFVLLWLVRWRRMRALVRTASVSTSGREADIMQRLAPRHAVAPLPIVVSDTPLEPGVFGIVRPVLLWPRAIGGYLSDAQVEAILAHELCHLRRRDNLAAALHMVVQAVFWFHPLVWWIGARLVDERERACDEEVIRRGSEPEVYAESILKTCKFFVESPLVCVAGVTGSNLKRRIEQIMTNNVSVTLDVWRKTLLVVAGLVAFVTPVAVGALNPPPQTRALPAASSLPAFEATSVRPNTTAGPGGRGGGQFQPERYVAQNVTLKTLVKRAYARPGSAEATTIDLLDQQIAGGPEWFNTDKFDIVATAGAQTPPARMRLMLQRLLADRFKLTARWESREMPVYYLVKARADGRLGAGMTPTSDEECAAGRRDGPVTPPEPGKPAPPPPCGSIQFGPGVLIARGAPMEWLANVLVTVPVISGIDRPVINRTGIEGNYGFSLKFAPAQAANPDPDRPHLMTALEEQLGLKLESTRAPVDVLVVDDAQKPEAN